MFLEKLDASLITFIILTRSFSIRRAKFELIAARERLITASIKNKRYLPAGGAYFINFYTPATTSLFLQRPCLSIRNNRCISNDDSSNRVTRFPHQICKAPSTATKRARVNIQSTLSRKTQASHQTPPESLQKRRLLRNRYSAKRRRRHHHHTPDLLHKPPRRIFSDASSHVLLRHVTRM